jgi:hypothetical protein
VTAYNTIIDDAAGTASGTVVFSAQPANGDTITIDSKVYTFQTTLTNVNGHVLIGENRTDTMENLAAAINAYSSPSILGVQSGVDYAAATTEHTTVSADKVDDHTMLLTAKSSGTAGAKIVSSTSSAITLTSPQMGGGTDGLTADGLQNIISWYGGYCDVNISGVWGGASVDIVCCNKIPASGDLSEIADTDWVALAPNVTSNSHYSSYLNPCLLSAKVSGSSGTTALRIVATPSPTV